MPPKNPTPQTPIKNTSQVSTQIIFGPVLSRRFGRSLGVDLSPSRSEERRVGKEC